MNASFEDRKAMFSCMRNWAGGITLATLKHQLGWRDVRFHAVFQALEAEGSVDRNGPFACRGDWYWTEAGRAKYELGNKAPTQLMMFSA